jgi:RHS repeat-associated protein
VGAELYYDGFGNLLSQAPKPGFPGASPNVYLTVNGANNRISSLHWSYDANGNTTHMPVMGGGAAALAYDVDNRLTRWTGAAGDEFYGYLADNKRVWKKAPGGVETYYLYGLGGQKLMTCSVVESPFALNCAMTHVYFGGKVIRADGEAVVQDRLGSVVARGGMKRDYFPYGDEIGGATAGNVDKFGTYMRDQTTGLDYADQRYYAGNMSGRFLTADPYEASGGAAEPSSWNRYPYVGGDPVNANDPEGLFAIGVVGGGRVVYNLGVFFRALGLGFLLGGNARKLGDPAWQTDAQVGAIVATREKAFWKQVGEDSSDEHNLAEPSYLKVIEDCYMKPLRYDPDKDYSNANLERRRRYQTLDQWGRAMTATAGLEVREHFNTRFGSFEGGAVWREGQKMANGVFDDQIYKAQGGTSTDFWTYQSFTGQTGYMASPNNLMIIETNGNMFTTLGMHVTNGRININGDGAMVNGKPRWCDSPSTVSF